MTFLLGFFLGELSIGLLWYLVSRAETTEECLEDDCARCARYGRDCDGPGSCEDQAAEDLAEWREAARTWNRKN